MPWNPSLPYSIPSAVENPAYSQKPAVNLTNQIVDECMNNMYYVYKSIVMSHWQNCGREEGAEISDLSSLFSAADVTPPVLLSPGEFIIISQLSVADSSSLSSLSPLNT